MQNNNLSVLEPWAVPNVYPDDIPEVDFGFTLLRIGLNEDVLTISGRSAFEEVRNYDINTICSDALIGIADFVTTYAEGITAYSEDKKDWEIYAEKLHEEVSDALADYESPKKGGENDAVEKMHNVLLKLDKDWSTLVK
jgi:hypothetical protein